MPPAVIAIAATVATVAVKVYVASALLSAILLTAIAVASSALMRKSSKSLTQGQELQLKLDPTMPRQVALGRTATGGSLVWAFTYTDDSKKPNRYLVRIIQLSDLPITGMVSIRNGKETITFAGDISQGLYASDQFRSKKGAACLWARLYKGSETAVADANLIAWSGGLWTSAHKGVNNAYIILRMDQDPDAFPNGEPQLIYEIDGAKLYDERYDSTAGGSGSQRLDNKATWAYSRNASVITANVLRGLYSAGVLLVGAQAEARDLDTAMLMAAHNICDTTIPTGGGSTVPRYRAGIMTNSSESTGSLLLELQSAFDGRIVDRGGSITVRPGAVRTPVVHFTDDDVVWTEQKSWQPRSSLTELTNYIIGTFVSEENGYQDKAFPIRRNAAWELDDGGERFTRNMSFRAVSNDTQVQFITKRVHNASRFQGTVAFVVPFWAVEIEQDDWFTMTSDRWGFTSKTFVAQKVDIIMSDQLMIAVYGREISPTSSEWSSADEVARGDTYWNSPGYDLTLPDLDLSQYYSFDATSLKEEFGIRVEIENLAEGIDASHIELELALATNLAGAYRVGMTTAVNQVYTVTGLKPSTAYAMRCRTTDGQRYSDYTTWEYITTTASQVNLAETLEGMNEAIAAAQAQIDAIEASIDVDFTELNEAVDNLEADVATAQSNITSLQSTTSSLGTSVTTLQGQVSTAQSNITSLQSSTSALNTSVGTLQSQMTAAQGSITSIQSSVGSLNTSVTSLNTSVSNLQTQATGIINTANALAATVTAQGGSISTIQSTLSTQGAAITTLQTTVSNTAGDVATLETQVNAGGGNLLVNTDLAVDTSGWSFGLSGANGSTGGRNLPSSQWYPPNENTLVINQPNTTSTGYGEWTQVIEVAAGKWLDVSCRVAAHRCDTQIYLRFLDVNGADLTIGTTGLIAATGGGSNLSSFPVRSFKIQAPSTAVRARLTLRKFGTNSGTTDSWAWFLRPQVAETLETTATPVAYSPGSARASIATQAQAVSTLTTSVATLSTTVSTQGSSISTLQTSVTTLQGSVATLQTTVATQGASITTNASAITSLTGSLAEYQLRLSSNTRNLLPNGGPEAYLRGWSGSVTYTVNSNNSEGPYFLCTPTASGTYVFSSDPIPMEAGVSLTLGYETRNTGGATCYCDIICYDSVGGILLDGGQNTAPDGTTWGDRAARAYTITTPANTTTVRVRMVTVAVDGTSRSRIKQIKLEKGTNWTAYSDEASVTQSFTALSSAEGSLATLSTTVATQGSSITTLQSSLTTTQGSLATLTTTVSSQGGSITTLQSSMTTAQGNISTLQSTVSSQGSSITTLQSTVSTAQGNIATLQTQINAGGGNLLVNTDFAIDTSGWSFGNPGGVTGISGARVASGDPWMVTDENGLRIEQTNGTTTGYSEWEQFFPVQGGKWYDTSVRVAAHRCQIQVYTSWRDESNATISSPSSGLLTPLTGGNYLEDWTHVGFKAQAPANAVRARIVLRKWGTLTGASPASSYAWFLRPQFAETTATSASPLAYSPGSAKATIAAQAQVLSTANSTLASLSTTVSTQGSSITTLQSSFTSLNGTVATLSSTVTAQGASITTLQTASTTQAGQISSLNTTVATQGSSITTLQSSMSTAQGNIASLTTRVNASQTNLLANGGLENGFNTGVASSGNYTWSISAEWGPNAYTTVNGTQVFTFADITTVQVGATYWIHCDAIAYGSSSIYCDLIFINAGGTIILDGPQNSQVGVFNFSPDNTRRSLIAVSAVAPSGTTRIQARIVANVVGNQIAGFRRVKVETGPTWTDYSSEASIVSNWQVLNNTTTSLSSLSTTVSTQGGSITTLQSSMTSAQGSISTLQSTVSTHGTSISNLQTTSTTQAGQIATLNSTVTTQGSAISTNASAITTLTGNVSTLSTIVTASSNPNLVPNGGFENGLNGWTAGGRNPSSWVQNNWVWGFWAGNSTGYTGSSGANYCWLESDSFGMAASNNFTMSFDADFQGGAGCVCYGSIAWFNSSGGLISYSDTAQVGPRSFDNTGASRIKATFTSPAGTVTAKARVVFYAPNGVTINAINFRHVKVEFGSIATPYSGEATAGSLYQAYATLNTSFASLSTTVSSQGGSITTLQSSYTSLNGTVSTLSSTVSAQGASITSLQSTTSTQAGQISTLQTQVRAGGGNLLINTEANSLAGWDYGNTGLTAVFAVNSPSDDWRPAPDSTFTIQQSNNTTSGYSEFAQYVAVVAGKYYDFSLLWAAHRCKIELIAQWFDINGSQVGGISASGQLGPAGGGNKLADFTNASFSAQAPTGAVKVRFYMRKMATLSGNADSWAWFVRPQVVETYAGASSPVAYSQGSARAVIQTQATAIATLNSQYSSLSSTVSTQGATISSQATAITTLQGTQATLSSTVSSQGSMITTLQTTTSTLQGDTATLRTQVTAGNPNLLRNGGFELGNLNYWTPSGGSWSVYGGTDTWGTYASNSTNVADGSYTFIDSAPVNVEVDWYTLTADVGYFISGGSGTCYLEIIYLNSSNAVIGQAGGPAVANGRNFSSDGSTRRDLKCTVLLPSGTAKIYARVVWYKASGTIQSMHVRQVKLERGQVATPYSAEATVRQSFEALSTLDSQYASLSSTVSTQGVTISSQATAITTAQNGVNTLMGKVGVSIDADGFVAGWELNNNGTNGQMIINVDRFALGRKVSGTNQFTYPFEMIGTTTYIKNASIQDAAITNAKIANLSVDTIKIADNAVIIPVIAYTAASIGYASSVWANTQSASIVSSGAPIGINMSFYMVASRNAFVVNQMRLLRDGAVIFGPVTLPAVLISGTNIGFLGSQSYTFMDQPGAGSHTYEMQIYRDEGTLTISHRVITLTEYKK